MTAFENRFVVLLDLCRGLQGEIRACAKFRIVGIIIVLINFASLMSL
jgi:hypothetical protein